MAQIELDLIAKCGKYPLNALYRFMRQMELASATVIR
jgi:hypothetical protein